MTPVSCFCDLLCIGDNFALLRQSWGQFCSSLGAQVPELYLAGVVQILWLVLAQFVFDSV